MMKLYERISACQYTCPSHFAPEAADLIGQLLRRKPHERLGVIKGELRTFLKHEWFEDFDKEGLKNRTLRAPIIPYIEDNADMANFDFFDR
jgi:serine/threonine protein kinase